MIKGFLLDKDASIKHKTEKLRTVLRKETESPEKIEENGEEN